jgi:hypothetical protein
MNLALTNVTDKFQVMDMFFVHQRGTMNGVYLIMVAIGVWTHSPLVKQDLLIVYSPSWHPLHPD